MEKAYVFRIFVCGIGSTPEEAYNSLYECSSEELLGNWNSDIVIDSEEEV